MDDAATNKKFAESLNVDYPILSDPDKKVAQSYGVLIPVVGVPNRWTFYIGADGKILAIDKDVHVENHGADVAGKLGELGVKKNK